MGPIYIETLYTFHNGICPKVNIITWPEFELAYNIVAVQQVSHYPNVSSLLTFLKNLV